MGDRTARYAPCEAQPDGERLWPRLGCNAARFGTDLAPLSFT